MSIRLAKKFKGQVISADSRQVYKGLDIGSGKITKKEAGGVRHYLLDVANPKSTFSVAKYQKLAIKAVKTVQKGGFLPFLVGGTGFYIQSVVDGILLPEVPPDTKLRRELAKLPPNTLYDMLLKLDPGRAGTIDAKNPIRLIRAIEIIKTTKKPISKLVSKPEFETLQIGITKSPAQLKKLIGLRLQKRLPGIINEVKKLHTNGLSWKRLEELGLEYRYVAQYLQDKLPYKKMVELLQLEIQHYAKRQMTWFKRDSRIHWVPTYRQAEALTRKFLQ